MTRVLVTGGSGFIGTNLVEHFACHGDQVLNIDFAKPRNPDHAKYWMKLDILEKDILIKAIQDFRPHFIFHAAARTDLNGRDLTEYPANTLGVSNIVEATRGLLDLKRIIFFSSMLVCRAGYQPRDDDDYCPTTAYGASKADGEKIVRQNCSGIPCTWVIVRPTSIWGPWFDAPYKDFFVMIERGLYFHPLGKILKKSYGFVGNTVYQIERIAQCSDHLVHTKTLYLADYPPIETGEWADKIQELMKARKIIRVPVSLLRGAAITGDLLRWFGISKYPITSFRLDNLLNPRVYDLSLLEAICERLPYNMADGVRMTVNWMYAQKEISNK